MLFPVIFGVLAVAIFSYGNVEIGKKHGANRVY
jgi:hypothetical protein